MYVRNPILIAVCIALSACAVQPVTQQAPPPAAVTPAADAGQQLNALVDGYFEEQLQLNPLLATYIGDNRYNDRLPNFIGPEFRAQSHELNARYLADVRRTDPAALGSADRISYDIFVH